MPSSVTVVPSRLVSPPFKSPYGYHIIKWEPLVNDPELLDISKREFKGRKESWVMAKIEQGAKVERFPELR